MDFSVYIKPDLLILVPVLNLTGYWIKNTGKVKSSYIPIILGIISILLCCIKSISIKEYENIYEYIFTSATQGILIAAASVYSNQIYRQFKTPKGGDNTDDGNDTNI